MSYGGNKNKKISVSVRQMLFLVSVWIPLSVGMLQPGLLVLLLVLVPILTRVVPIKKRRDNTKFQSNP